MSKVDVRALGKLADVFVSGTDIVDCHVGDLERFASLVLEEAAKVCEKVRGACVSDPGWIRSDDCVRSVRALKPVQS